MPSFKKLPLAAIVASATVGIGVAVFPSGCLHAQEPLPPPPSGANSVKPVAPPQGAKVLFSGTQEDLDKNWSRNGDRPARWVVADGAMQVRRGDIQTREEFQDYLLHVEYRVPNLPDRKGQAKGNSGVFMNGIYEIQVLDSYGISTPGKGDAGAIYNQAAPLVNAGRPPLEWQTFDIIFRSPRFNEAGEKIEPAMATVLHNGIPIHNNQVIQHGTGGRQDQKEPERGPIRLQDHGNPVQYRNIWIVPLPLKGSDKY